MLSDSKPNNFKMSTKFTITPTLRVTQAYQKKDGTYPIKLNIFDSRTKKRRYIGIDMSMTVQDFEWMMHPPTGKVSAEYKTKKNHLTKQKVLLDSEVERAVEIATKLKTFTLSGFKEGNSGNTKSLLLTIEDVFNYAITERKESGKIGTAKSYEQTLKRVKEFHNVVKKKKTDLLFDDITKKWLEDFERWMSIDRENKNKKGGSLSSVGIYLRNLRSVYNIAIDEKIVPKDIYPFLSHDKNKKGYTIPQTRKTNKGLNDDELMTLYNAEPKTPQQKVAKDFWFFSFLSNGMNFKDVALLRFKVIKDDHFDFVRAKTQNTRKDDLNPISVILTDYHYTIFTTYGNKKINSTDFVFDIIKVTDTEEQKHTKIGNFLRMINQHLKILAKENGISAEISYQWARHTSTQTLLKSGVSPLYISQSLGHTKLSTTTAYTGSLSIDEKKEISNMQMNKLTRKPTGNN